MAKKAVKKKTAKKAPAKKAAKKAPAKRAAKKAVKKAAKKAAATPPVDLRKAAIKKAAKRVVKKKEVAEPEEIAPPVIKRAYVKPDKVAKLTTFQKKQQQKLKDLRDQITDMMQGMQKDTIKNLAEGSEANGSGMHQADAGTDSYDRDFALNMLSKEADALNEIEEALQRLEMGTYGICEKSKKKIPQARLEALPFARLSVECQAELERESAGYQTGPGRDVFGFN
ncbi:MAG: TraR/DksA family transcriptional regulator [Akkermansiaceae bacterium]